MKSNFNQLNFKKRLICLVFISLIYTISEGQQDQLNLQSLYPVQGNYTVGYQHFFRIDSTRSYKRLYNWSNSSGYREIPISIWYPAATAAEGKSHLKIQDYLRIVAIEEEWEMLPDIFLLDWFEFPNNQKNRDLLVEESWATKDLPLADGPFPAIVYAPSYQASSTENFSFCEFLASHGFIVIASPSRGTDHRFLDGGTARDVETQCRDINFLLKIITGMPQVNGDKVTTMGFSFGGLSNVLSQMSHHSLKAIISLDGSIKYQLPTIQKSPYYNIDRVDVPFVHFSQKPIPMSVMIEDDIDTTLNKNFQFFDDLLYSDAYRITMKHLSHPQFSTMGVLLKDRDIRQDGSDLEIMNGFRWIQTFTLEFLKAYILKKEQSFETFLMNDTFTIYPPIYRASRHTTLTFEDYHDLLITQDYKNAIETWTRLQKASSDLQVQEWQLNNLGLQLGFQSHKLYASQAIFDLAFHLFPNSGNLHDSLAEVLLAQDQIEKAKLHFIKSLQLDPSNQNAIKRLAELR